MLESKVTTPEKSSAAPAAACRDEILYLAWTGTDLHLNSIRSGDLRQFEDKRCYGHTSYTTETTTTSSSDGRSRTESRTVALPPAVAAVGRGLHLAWTGSDGHVNVMNADAQPPAHTRLSETSTAAPALAGLGNELVLAWTGTDRHLNVMTSRGGEFEGPAARLEET